MADEATPVVEPTAEAPAASQEAASQAEGNPAPVAEGEPAAEAGIEPAKEAEPKSEAPEDYGDFSDEKGVAFSSKDMPEFTAMAKELGLSKDRAQKLLMTMVPTVRTKLQTSLKSVNEQWKQAAISDPEIGGSDMKAKIEVSNKAFRKYVSPELGKLMKNTGLSMHPDFIRMFYRIGKQLEQDQGVAGTGAPQPKRRLFPNSNM